MFHPSKSACGIIAIVCLFGLAGCGDDGDGTPLPPPAVQTGYLVGKLIDHVPYVCGTRKGRTGRLGQFSYFPDDSCTFSVGKMTFPVSAAKVAKGYLTAYDLTSSPTEAWTLMAILESIAYRRPGSDLFTIVDGNLERRIPQVPLKDGDAAVTAALTTFAGSVKPVPVRAAYLRLLETVRDDNSLVVPLDTLVGRGKAVLDSFQIATESGQPWISPPSARAEETNHDNRVNLRIYDNLGNPLWVNNMYSNPVSLPYGGSTDPQLYSVWVSPGQNPDKSTPQVGFAEGDLTGSNIFGIDLDVGRSTTDTVGTGYQNAAFWQGPGAPPPTPPAPISIMAYGAHPSASENTAYPPSLNFAFSLQLQIATLTLVGSQYIQGNVLCDNVMFAQGSTKASLAAVFNFVYDLGDTAMQGVEMVSDDGADVSQTTDFLKSFKTLTKAAIDLATSNWWVVAVNAQTPSYRMTMKGNPAVMMQCVGSGSSGASAYIPVVITSTYDDHTFDVYVTYPGQALQGITLN